MINLPESFITNKNKMVNPEPFLKLFEIEYDTGLYIRGTNDVDNTVYNGHTYLASLGFVEGNKDENSQGNIVRNTIIVNNVGLALTNFLKTYDGLRGKEIVIYTVDNSDLTEITPLIETYTILETVELDDGKAQFTVGKKNKTKYKFPKNRYSKNICRYKFRSTACNAPASAFTECNRTLTDCIERGNEDRFDGFASFPVGSIQNLNVSKNG